MADAGWHADPIGRHQYRYWDGEAWTDLVADDGAQSTDPLTSSAAQGPDLTAPPAWTVPVAIAPAVPWYDQTWFVVTALIVFFPVGLALVWRKSWDQGVKMGVTLAVVIVVTGSAILLAGNGFASSANHGVAIGSPPPSPPAGGAERRAPESLVEKVTSVPAHVYDTVGQGTAYPLPEKLPGPRLTNAAGKPRIVYIGAEYCPFCATERWAIVAALSRFGTFSNLQITESADTPETYPHTQTFSFHGSSYRSRYITFEPTETETNTESPLDTPTPEQQELQNQYDAPPYQQGSDTIPFIDFADEYLVSSSTYDPGVLQGKTYDQIADALSDPTSAISQGAIGAANGLSAAICKVTHDQPADVCDSPAVTSLEHQLGQSH